MELLKGAKFKKVSTGDVYTVIDIDDKNAVVRSNQGEDVSVACSTLKDKRRYLPHVEDTTEPIGELIKKATIEIARSVDAVICESTTGKFVSFKVDNKMFAAIFTSSKKSMTLGVRSAAIEKMNLNYKKMRHSMDARFSFTTLSEEDKKLIQDLLVSARDYQKNRKKKEDK